MKPFEEPAISTPTDLAQATQNFPIMPLAGNISGTGDGGGGFGGDSNGSDGDGGADGPSGTDV
jgi:hypothetical protein